MGRRIAVVLFNLGGPDTGDDVRPFLKNLFRDPAIIRAPLPVRWALARLISATRAPVVKENYALMDAGGGSPLLSETRKQASVLETHLQDLLPDDLVKCFIAMRYWHPLTEETAAEVKAWNADEVVLLPLYPQFSTTTTGSSLTAWNRSFKGKSRLVCCYPFEEKFISAHIDRIMQAWEKDGKPETVRLLLSAHGLPESVVRAGDPYQWQCEKTAELIRAGVPPEWDVRVCYQSRVGPLKWIGPATEEEIEKAAEEGFHILISPIAFVSEHIETLVELGEEYRLVAEKHGARGYTRVEALGTHPSFIESLSGEVMAALEMTSSMRSCRDGRLCPAGMSGCPHEEMTGRKREAGEKIPA